MSLGLFIKRRSVWVPCAFVTALVLIYALWPGPKAAPPSPLPSPNGYDDFTKAGQLLNKISGDYRRMPKEELQSYVGTNQESLRLVRLGLERECQVPTEDSTARIQTRMLERSSISELARLLLAQGRLAETEGRYQESAKSYLEVVRFGQSSSRGGLLAEKILGFIIENMGMTGLENVVGQLNAPSCRSTVNTLEKVDASSNPAEEYIKRDRQWARNAPSWKDRIQAVWMSKSLFPYRAADEKFTAKLMATDQRRRLLMLKLASRAYELENGKRPSRAEDLVPSLLRAVPKDPETGTNLVLISVP